MPRCLVDGHKIAVAEPELRAATGVVFCCLRCGWVRNAMRVNSQALLRFISGPCSKGSGPECMKCHGVAVGPDGEWVRCAHSCHGATH